MNFNLSDEHETLRASAQAFLDKEVDLAPLLVPGATVATADYEGLWTKIAALGWPGMVIPQAHGGLGLDYLDLIMIIGEMGRTLAPAPLFGTLAGAWVIEKAASPALQTELLGQVAQGSLKLALAIADIDGSLEGAGADMTARQQGEDWVLSGTRAYVVDAPAADKLVVSASFEGQRDFFLVDAHAPGVTIEPVEWRDITRQVATVRLDDVAGQRLDQGDADTWPWVRDRLYLLLAAESAAGARKVLDDAVDYAKQRVAFGRPIGSYQVIKHQLADIFALTECATAAVQYAAWTLSQNDPRAPLAAAMAQSYTADAYRDATYRNIQVHGAIGFTWEMVNHLYYKRARCNAELLGPPAMQREHVIQFLQYQSAA